NASKRGDTVDDLTRLFFTSNLTLKQFIAKGKNSINKHNKAKTGTVISMTDNYYTQLYNILEQYRKYFTDNNYTVFANTPSLSGIIGSEGRMAGTIDLLLQDNKTGKYYIVDLKTSSSDRVKEYEGADKWDYRGKDQIQQNAYRELFAQVTGKK